MKVVFVVRHVDSSGGRERILTHKANYFARVFGYRVSIVTLFQRRDATYFPLDALVTIRHLRLQSPKGFAGGDLAFRRYVKTALSDELRALAPDITITLWWGIEFKLLPDIPYAGRRIVEQHFSQHMRDRLLTQAGRSLYFKLRVRLNRWIENRALRRYDAYVVLTREDRAHWDHPRLSVIPNPVSLVEPAASDCSAPVVLSVGRLGEQKGFDRLLRIWAKVEARHPDWRLIIRGDGDSRDELLAQIRELRLSRASIEPATPRIEEEMRQASIFALTSRYEGFGLVLIEAMQCGVPVVSYDTRCGPRDIIDDGVTGFLVREDDEATFAERLERLMLDRSLRLALGAAGMRSVNERFDEASVMQEWKRLFESLPPRS